ncbi:MAG: transglutaminase domain-containing protein [Prevotellaceae bacterium]|nr:transglutaminase domain-containing protein [Prevotellaceae bacterium]
MKVIRFILLLACQAFVLHMPILAQPASDLSFFSQAYPNSNSVEIKNRTKITINIKDKKIEILHDHYSERILLTDITTTFANEKVYYSTFMPLLSIKAWSLVPNGEKYKKIMVRDFSHSSDIDDYIFYDDSRACSFVFPNLSKGSKLIYEVQRKILDPHMIPKVYFSSYGDCWHSEIEIDYDNAVDLDLYNFAFSKDSLSSYTIEKGKRRTVVKMSKDNIKAISSEKFVQNYMQYLPIILPRIKAYKPSVKEDSVRVLPNITYLHKYYRSFIDSMDSHNDTLLTSVADSITASLNTEKDKVKAIYYWVQDHIKYIAVEDGEKGYIPTDAYTVYHRRHGDCKGMANLIHVMLRQININAYLTWVGSKDLPFKYSEIPSPLIDNHMVCSYFDKDGKFYILDGTSDFQNIETPSLFIQGKECLISLNKDSFLIKEIPYKKNMIDNHSRISILGTDAVINEQMKIEGETRRKLAYKLSHKTEMERKKFYVGQLEASGFAKSTLSDIQIGDLSDRDNPLSLSGNYTLNDYLIKSNDRLYLKLFARGLESLHIEDNRKLDFELSCPQERTWEEEINIPKGYIVESLPGNSSFTDSRFSFSSKFRQTKGKVYINISLVYNTTRLKKGDFGRWNEMNDLVQNFITQSIVFKQKQNKKQ